MLVPSLVVLGASDWATSGVALSPSQARLPSGTGQVASFMVAGSCQESTGCGYVVRRLTTSLTWHIVETVANAFAYSIPGTTTYSSW